MPTKVKTQKDYLLTEVTIELPVNIGELDALMRSIKASGKLIILYQDGGYVGVSVEQKTKTTAGDAIKVRDLLSIGTTAL